MFLLTPVSLMNLVYSLVELTKLEPQTILESDSALKSTTFPYPPELEDLTLDIIWQNVYCDENTDFVSTRRRTKGPVERVLVQFAKLVEQGIFEQVISMNASQHMFCVTVACTKPDVLDLIVSVG